MGENDIKCQLLLLIMNKNIAWFFVGLLILGSVFVGYPIYRDHQKADLVAKCREYSRGVYEKRWGEYCEMAGFGNPKCSLLEESARQIEEAAENAEENCIKQNFPKKYE